jgi:hypothetical protein
VEAHQLLVYVEALEVVFHHPEVWTLEFAVLPASVSVMLRTLECREGSSYGTAMAEATL